MRNEHSGKNTRRPPRCPSCARIMRFARASRFGDLYIWMPSLWRVAHRRRGNRGSI